MYKRENIVRHRFILLMSTKWWIWYPLDLLISNIYQSPKYLWVKLTDVSNKISASYTPTPIFYLLLFYYFIINIILSLKRQPSCREEGRSFYHFFEVTTFPHCTFQHFEYFFSQLHYCYCIRVGWYFLKWVKVESNERFYIYKVLCKRIFLRNKYSGQ